MRTRDRRRVPALGCLLVVALLSGCAERATPSDAAPTAAPQVSATRVPASTGFAEMGPVGDDGCFDRAATGVTVRDVSVYQSLRIDLISGGTVIRPADRTVDLVAGKDARVGIDIETAPGWATREIALRVSTVEPSGESTTWSTRLVPSPAPAPTDPTSLGTAVVDIPADSLTATSRLAVAIVECTVVGNADPMPADTTEVDLAARRTGGIRVHLVPFQVAGFVPDTSEPVIAGYREALLAMYPVTDVDITVGDLEDGGDRPDLGALLVTVGRIRDVDRPAEDVYYYGMATGAASRETYCDDCITGTSEAGGGSGLGFAIGAAFGDQRAEDTLLHELGHAHGLEHAPCGDVDRPDAAFPYPDGRIGVPGYDRRTQVLVPASTNDLMGYCFPRWISDHNYQLLVERVAAVNGQRTDP